eukprot:15114285-Ditylum_brightwellii.AAC.1
MTPNRDQEYLLELLTCCSYPNLQFRGNNNGCKSITGIFIFLSRVESPIASYLLLQYVVMSTSSNPPECEFSSSSGQHVVDYDDDKLHQQRQRRRRDEFGDCALVEIVHLHDCLRGALRALQRDVSDL